MHRLKTEASIVVFLLFFGTALLDALRDHAWFLSMIYVLLGGLFLFADSRQNAAKAA